MGNHAQQYFHHSLPISPISQIEQLEPVGYYDRTGLFVINQSNASQLTNQNPTLIRAAPNLTEPQVVRHADPQGAVSDSESILLEEFAPKDPKCQYPHPLWGACTIGGPLQQMDCGVPPLPEPVHERPGVMLQPGSTKPSEKPIHMLVQSLPAVAVDEQTAAAFGRAREAFQGLPADQAGPTYPDYVYRPNPLLRTRDYENKNNSMNLQDEDFYCRVKELQHQMARKPPPDLSRISSRVFQADVEDLPSPPVRPGHETELLPRTTCPCWTVAPSTHSSCQAAEIASYTPSLVRHHRNSG